jgi:hypothetical protein
MPVSHSRPFNRPSTDSSSFRLDTEHDVKRHIREEHCKVDLECPSCYMKFRDMVHFVRHVNFPPYRCRLVYRDDFEKVVDKFTGGVLTAEPIDRSDADAVGVQWSVSEAGMEAVAAPNAKVINGRTNIWAQMPKLSVWKRFNALKEATGRTWAGMEGQY